MPPYWALGFQISRFGYSGTDDMRSAVERTLKYDIPLVSTPFIFNFNFLAHFVTPDVNLQPRHAVRSNPLTALYHKHGHKLRNHFVKYFS